MRGNEDVKKSGSKKGGRFEGIDESCLEFADIFMKAEGLKRVKSGVEGSVVPVTKAMLRLKRMADSGDAKVLAGLTLERMYLMATSLESTAAMTPLRAIRK